MNGRTTSENADAVGLFPFLAVLLCTMGALLVLLVVLAQRAGQRAVEAQTAAPKVEKVLPVVTPSDREESTKLAQQLEEVRAGQKRLDEQRTRLDARLKDEQDRLAHSEEHTRRLEHELAKLSLAAQQLKATESNQNIDQQQAERELDRLQKLIADTQSELEEMRSENIGQKSYAIVPYTGPNGTRRRPIYIVCSGEGVEILPEGIRFPREDFIDTSWPGNPLAAVLRASRDYYNERAAKTGSLEPPDPYPLILVRPDGIQQYTHARAAIASWDTDFGYEFIDADWKLEFPGLADPQLARRQHHAAMLARENLARLVRSAPRRFRGLGIGRTSTPGGGSQVDGSGYGQTSGSGTEEALGQPGQGNSPNGSGWAAKNNASGESAQDEATTEAEKGLYGGSGGSATGDASTPLGTDTSTQSETSESQASQGSAGGSAARSASQQSQGSANGSANGSSAGNSSSASSGQVASGSSSSSFGGSPKSATIRSIADSRGSNWAVSHSGAGAVPIRRPIQVVVRKDQLSLLPTKHAHSGVEATGTVISLNQPDDKISEQFVESLRTRIAEWGLAGNGLYWRPVLQLRVGPEAQQTAKRLIRMLDRSGVELQQPETARGGFGNATR